MDRKKCRPGSDFESHPPPLFPAHLHQPLPGSHPRRLVVAAEHVHRDDGRIVLAVRQDALARLALELRVQALDCVGGADRLPDRPGEGIVREDVHARLGEHPRHPLVLLRPEGGEGTECLPGLFPGRHRRHLAEVVADGFLVFPYDIRCQVPPVVRETSLVQGAEGF